MAETEMKKKRADLNMIWFGLHGCTNVKNHYKYDKYGQVVVHPPWQMNRGNGEFTDWGLSVGFEIGQELSRIDETKGFTPDNCKFVEAGQGEIHRYDMHNDGQKPVEKAIVPNAPSVPDSVKQKLRKKKTKKGQCFPHVRETLPHGFWRAEVRNPHNKEFRHNLGNHPTEGSAALAIIRFMKAKGFEFDEAAHVANYTERYGTAPQEHVTTPQPPVLNVLRPITVEESSAKLNSKYEYVVAQCRCGTQMKIQKDAVVHGQVRRCNHCLKEDLRSRGINEESIKARRDMEITGLESGDVELPPIPAATRRLGPQADKLSFKPDEASKMLDISKIIDPMEGELPEAPEMDEPPLESQEPPPYFDDDDYLPTSQMDPEPPPARSFYEHVTQEPTPLEMWRIEEQQRKMFFTFSTFEEGTMKGEKVYKFWKENKVEYPFPRDRDEDIRKWNHNIMLKFPGAEDGIQNIHGILDWLDTKKALEEGRDPTKTPRGNGDVRPDYDDWKLFFDLSGLNPHVEETQDVYNAWQNFRHKNSLACDTEEDIKKWLMMCGVRPRPRGELTSVFEPRDPVRVAAPPHEDDLISATKIKKEPESDMISATQYPQMKAEEYEKGIEGEDWLSTVPTRDGLPEFVGGLQREKAVALERFMVKFPNDGDMLRDYFIRKTGYSMAHKHFAENVDQFLFYWVIHHPSLYADLLRGRRPDNIFDPFQKLDKPELPAMSDASRTDSSSDIEIVAKRKLLDMIKEGGGISGLIEELAHMANDVFDIATQSMDFGKTGGDFTSISKIHRTGIQQSVDSHEVIARLSNDDVRGLQNVARHIKDRIMSGEKREDIVKGIGEKLAREVTGSRPESISDVLKKMKNDDEAPSLESVAQDLKSNLDQDPGGDEDLAQVMEVRGNTSDKLMAIPDMEGVKVNLRTGKFHAVFTHETGQDQKIGEFDNAVDAGVAYDNFIDKNYPGKPKNSGISYTVVQISDPYLKKILLESLKNDRKRIVIYVPGLIDSVSHTISVLTKAFSHDPLSLVFYSTERAFRGWPEFKAWWDEDPVKRGEQLRFHHPCRKVYMVGNFVLAEARWGALQDGRIANDLNRDMIPPVPFQGGDEWLASQRNKND